MRIVAVDDEKLALEGIVSVIQKVRPDDEIVGFRNPLDALTDIEQNGCDVAFLDMEMYEMHGVDLARRLKLDHPMVNIIFTTGYSQYMGEAFAMHASGYLLKPITREKVEAEFMNLRYIKPVSDKAGIRVQTFGNFEVFIEEEPVKFQYSKTKEMFAYLIDRNGAMCTNGELVGILWEDSADGKQKESYLKNLKADLLHLLAEAGCADILVKQRGKIAVNPEKVNCDYYAWLKGEAWAINAYRGEYMIQYGWSEFSYGKFM